VPAQQGIGAACVAERIRGIEDFSWLSLPAAMIMKIITGILLASI